MFISAVEAVTPSSRFNSMAVDVTAFNLVKSDCVTPLLLTIVTDASIVAPVWVDV